MATAVAGKSAKVTAESLEFKAAKYAKLVAKKKALTAAIDEELAPLKEELLQKMRDDSSFKTEDGEVCIQISESLVLDDEGLMTVLRSKHKLKDCLKPETLDASSVRALAKKDKEVEGAMTFTKSRTLAIKK